MGKVAKHPDGLTYKAHTVHDLFHNECWSFLTGNGSTAIPYQCPCGTWQYETNSAQLRLVKKTEVPAKGGDT
jgi:hypothetical protein